MEKSEHNEEITADEFFSTVLLKISLMENMPEITWEAHISFIKRDLRQLAAIYETKIECGEADGSYPEKLESIDSCLNGLEKNDVRTNRDTLRQFLKYHHDIYEAYK